MVWHTDPVGVIVRFAVDEVESVLLRGLVNEGSVLIGDHLQETVAWGLELV